MAAIRSQWYMTVGEPVLRKQLSEVSATYTFTNDRLTNLLRNEHDPRYLVRTISESNLVSQAERETLTYPLIRQMGVAQMHTRTDAHLELLGLVPLFNTLMTLLKQKEDERIKRATADSIPKPAATEGAPNTNKVDSANDAKSAGGDKMQNTPAPHPAQLSTVMDTKTSATTKSDDKGSALSRSESMTATSTFRKPFPYPPAVDSPCESDNEYAVCFADKEDNTEDEGYGDGEVNGGTNKVEAKAGNDEQGGAGAAKGFKAEEDWIMVEDDMEGDFEMIEKDD